MISHGAKCSHCRGNMSAPKPVTEGPRVGQTRTFCIKCGHIHYDPAPRVKEGSALSSDAAVEDR